MELGPNQKLWLADLRSGRFKQGSGKLCVVEDDGSKAYCCLGLGCERALGPGQPHPHKDLDRIKVWYGSSQNYPKTEGMYCGSALPPDEFWRDWLGLHNQNGNPEQINLDALTTMNDRGVPFPEIADIVEANPEAYFARSL